MAINPIIAEKLEAAKKTKSFILNCQRLTDVPDTVLDSEWCHQHLQSLHLKNNCIRKLVNGERIHLLKSLTQLSLGNNELEELPSSISMLTELETLSVFNNRLTQLPSTLGSMTKLRCLFASNNQLSSLPNGLWRAPQLVHVDLHSNVIGEIQTDIIHCQSLQMLFLMRNKLRYIPNQMTCLPHLNTLAVAANLLESFPLNVAGMYNLRHLSLADNRKLRRLPIDLLKLKDLQNLLISSVACTSKDTVNPHVIDEVGCIPPLQELSARVLRRTLEANKKLNPLFLWLPAQLAQSLSLPLTLCDWLVPSGVCHECGQSFFLYHIQREGNSTEFISEILGVDEAGRVGDKLDDYIKQNIVFTVSYCSVNCTRIQ